MTSLEACELLLPPPASVHASNATLELDATLRFCINEGAERPPPPRHKGRLERRVIAALGRCGVRAIPSDREDATLVLARSSGAAQSYRLRIDQRSLSIEAPDDTGHYYGLLTLCQWLEAHPHAPGQRRRIRGVEIADAPAVPIRGVMLDISRNKVPSLETLEAVIDQISAWKINHLQLYLEHTFAYAGHDTVWRGWSPLTGDEIRHLDAYCQERFVELAPNQNSFGHLHRWLVHEPYRSLAECPNGIEHPFSDRTEPFSLCPTDPASLGLLEDLYDQLLPCFESRRFNVGLDETFDLGRGRSAQACAAQGRGRVYLEFLNSVHNLVTARDHQMLFWGDIVLEHPELVPELPRDAVALAWGYEADHDFDSSARLFAGSGIDFWLCPGTSSWLSLGGRTDNALVNQRTAARAAREHGAAGLLNTDWGDRGHLQPLPVSALGIAAGAAYSWNPVGDRPTDWPAILDRHAFADRGATLGAAFFDLGNVYALASARSINASILFRILLETDGDLTHSRFDDLTIPSLELCRERSASIAKTLGSARSDRADASLLVDEAGWVCDGLDFLSLLGIARLETGRDRPVGDLPTARRLQLRERCCDLEQRARSIWIERNRPGGLERSMAVFQRLAKALS